MKGRCFWDVALQTRPLGWSIANRGLWWAFDSGWTWATTFFTWWSAIKPCLGIINWPLLKFISWLNSVKFFPILLFSYKQKLLFTQGSQWKRKINAWIMDLHFYELPGIILVESFTKALAWVRISSIFSLDSTELLFKY